ncbi:MAG: hypothetical protein WDM76_12115 [Limisphaerales bacterium]
MKFLTPIIIIAVFIATCAIANAANPTAIIPAPVKAEMREGVFHLQPGTRIIAEAGVEGNSQITRRTAPAGHRFCDQNQIRQNENYGCRYFADDK